MEGYLMSDDILSKVEQINRLANYLKRLNEINKRLDEHTTIKATDVLGNEINLLGLGDELFNKSLDLIPDEIKCTEEELRSLINLQYKTNYEIRKRVN